MPGLSDTRAAAAKTRQAAMFVVMPRVLIEVRRAYSPEQELGLMEAVHAALCQAFKIPPGDRNVRLVVHPPHRFACPPAREQPDAFTNVTIEAIAGRSLDAKRDLYRTIVANLEPFGLKNPNEVFVPTSEPFGNIGATIRRGEL